MAWKTLLNSTTTDASDVNDNFQFVASGSLLPRTSVGALMVTTDGAYDIGADATRWNDLYCNDVDFDGSLTTADKSLWTLEAETTLADTATSIEFTGLTGDTAIEYMLIGRAVNNHSTNTQAIRLIFNGDSAANYGRQYIQGADAAVEARRFTGEVNTSFMAAEPGSAASSVGLSRMIIHAKSGHERTMLLTEMLTENTSSSANVDRILSIAEIWDNTADEIIAMKFMEVNGNEMYTGTNIQLWKRG